jgi:hypothetical protein
MEEFIENVIKIYREEFLNLGFIPKYRFPEYYSKGQFFITENGFILTGSLHSEITPIYALYVYPEKRNGLLPIIELLKMLPKKKFRVRCLSNMKNLWIRMGLSLIRAELKNKRKREIFILEGFFSI